MRSGFVHQARLRLAPGADPRGPGGAVTLALCGAWEHPPPCPLAPHRTDLEPDPRGDDPAGGAVTVRVVFAADRADEERVRAIIDRALDGGRVEGPDGGVSDWVLVSSGPAELTPDEAALAGRIAKDGPPDQPS